MKLTTASPLLLLLLLHSQSCSVCAHRLRPFGGTRVLRPVSRPGPVAARPTEQYNCALQEADQLLSLRGGIKTSNSKRKKKTRKEKSYKSPDGAESSSIYVREKMASILNLIPSVNLGDMVGGNRYARQALDLWEETPPLTQVYVGCSVAVTLLAFIFNGNEFPAIMDMDWRRIFSRFEVWRLVTGFLYLGPLGVNYLLTLHFLWTYMGDLEKLNAEKPEEFLVLLGFGGSALMLCYLLLGISPTFIGHNIATYLVYLWSRANEGTSINMMDLFVVQAEFIPWFFCLQALVMDGEFPTADVLGIVIGHMYHYYLKAGSLTPPEGMRKVIPNSFWKKYKKILSSRNLEQGNESIDDDGNEEDVYDKES
jgi:Derlin-2/3